MGPPEDKPAGASGEQAASGGQEQGSSTAPTPGSATAAGGEALPDLRDEPSLEDVPVTAGAAQGKSQAKTAGTDGASGTSQPNGQAVGTAGGAPGTGGPGSQAPGGETANSSSGGGSGGYSGAAGVPSGSGGGGPLTPAEQVAILDAQLEKGAGQFDAMIQKTEAEQRAAAREQAARRTSVPASGACGSAGGSSGEWQQCR